MPDSDLVRDILEQMLKATYTIQRRFAPIQAPADFLASDEGIDRLDAICMQLIAVGESVKNLDKITDGAQIVYSVCAKHIPQLQQEIAGMLKDLAADSGA